MKRSKFIPTICSTISAVIAISVISFILWTEWKKPYAGGADMSVPLGGIALPFATAIAIFVGWVIGELIEEKTRA